jgi:hypothetical protein
VHTPEVQQQLARLLQLLHVDTSKGSLAEQLQVSSVANNSSGRSMQCVMQQQRAIAAGQPV